MANINEIIADKIIQIKEITAKIKALQGREAPVVPKAFDMKEPERLTGEALQAEQAKRGGEALLPYDLDAGLKEIGRGETMALNQDKLKATRNQFIPGTDEYINDLVKQYRSISSMADDAEGQARIDLIAQTTNIKNELANYPRGRVLMGLKAVVTPEVGGGTDGGDQKVALTAEDYKKLIDGATLKTVDAIRSQIANDDISRPEIVKYATDELDKKVRKLTPVVKTDKAVLSALDKLPATTMGSKITGMNTVRDMLSSASEEARSFRSANTQEQKDQSANAMLTILARLVAGGVLSDGEFDTAKATAGFDAALQSIKNSIGFVGKNVTDAQANAVLNRLSGRITAYNSGIDALKNKFLDYVDPAKEFRTKTVDTKVNAMLPDKVKDVFSRALGAGGSELVKPDPTQFKSLSDYKAAMVEYKRKGGK